MDSHLKSFSSDENEFMSLKDHQFPCRFRYMAEQELRLGASMAAKTTQPINHSTTIDVDEIQRVGPDERKHFSHRHSLLMYSLRPSDSIRCHFCETTIVGLGYGCKRCRYFLHQTCLEFPQTIEHLAHPGHQLTLQYTPSTTIGSDKFKCRACDIGDNPALLFNFHYSCNVCDDFTIHMGCASMPCKVLHKDITLSICYSNPLRNEAGLLLCDICDHSIDKTKSWVYYEKGHNFITHFSCAADYVYNGGKGTGGDDKSYVMGVKSGLTNLDGDDISIVHCHNEDDEDGTRAKNHKQLFFHRHPLQPMNQSDNHAKNRKCGICGLDLSSDKKRGCSNSHCDYIIHDRCSQLPQKIQHPLHQHPLKLIPKKDNLEVQCHGCRQTTGCNHTHYTVVYYCSVCDFSLHPSCAACPRMLKKLGLTLYYSFPFKNEVAKLWCNYCDKVINRDQWLYYGRNNDEKRHITCQLAIGVSNCYITLRDLEVE